MSCGLRVLVTAPILAGLVNAPNSIMRLTSPFTILLVFVFALSARSAGNYELKPQQPATIPKANQEQPVSHPIKVLKRGYH